ncbi:hypothetical protein ACJZ2D_016486 [Fusarium nematophilum]
MESTTEMDARPRMESYVDSEKAIGCPENESEHEEQIFPDIQTIKDCIPAHCFVPSATRSLGYVARDLALIALLAWSALRFIPEMPSQHIRWAAWVAYGFLQGLVCTGLWILAHEAGHGALTNHQRLNDLIGWLLHSSLLVPYFSWKSSHRRHHRYTGHITKDMAFVPRLWSATQDKAASPLTPDLHVFEDAPMFQLLKLIGHQLFGWQLYLLLNATAGKKSLHREEKSWLRQSHFDPTSAVFGPHESILIVLSDVGIGLTLGFLYYLAASVGWISVCLLYLVPYLWVHHWIVAITYLHHNHPDLYHYDDDGWKYVKGALSTVDRDFGWVGRNLFHGIIETHVVHHLFP